MADLAVKTGVASLGIKAAGNYLTLKLFVAIVSFPINTMFKFISESAEISICVIHYLPAIVTTQPSEYLLPLLR